MVVQHNITAMNSNRMLNVTTGSQAKSTEKLSSGYKINRAADDAAGLSISEKMRRQIRGLTQASSNAQDGISSVQTAEGALGEIHDMLQRMDELATKAANGTMSEGDRQNVQDEINQLLTEVDRVSETTKFNETYLLKGEKDSTRTLVNAHDAGLKGTLTDGSDGTMKTATFTMDKLNAGDTVNIAGKEYKIGEASSDLVTALDSATTAGIAGENNYTISAAAAGSPGVIGTDASGIAVGDSIRIDGGDAKTVGDITKSAAAILIENQFSATPAAAGDSFEVKYLDAAGNEQTDTYTAASIGGSLKWSTDGGINEAALQTRDNLVSFKAVGGTEQKVGDVALTDLATANYSKTLTHTNAAAGTTTSYATKDHILAAAERGEKVYIDNDLSRIYTHTFKDVTGPDNAPDGVSDTDANFISAEKAYSLIQNELKTASSIGADSNTTAVGNRTLNADDTVSFTITKGSRDVKNQLSLSLHVGSDADMTNKISVNIKAMDTKGLGINGLDVSGSDGSKATYAIDAIEDAIKKVSEQRSELGAVQNRLEHTVKNVDNVVENTTSAESQIRDTDMATEMVQYSKNNILAQAGQSMLAQANQSNQGVLSLLG